MNAVKSTTYEKLGSALCNLRAAREHLLPVAGLMFEGNVLDTIAAIDDQITEIEGLRTWIKENGDAKS